MLIIIVIMASNKLIKIEPAGIEESKGADVITSTTPPPKKPSGSGGGSGGGRGGRRNRNRWGNAKGATASEIDSFKGAIPELKGKTFTLEATQAAKYDEAVKALMSYISTKFDHRV